MLTSGGNTKATTDSTTAANKSQRLGEGRFSSPPMLVDQMEGSAPAGLVEEVKNYVGIELELVSYSFFLILIVGFDERPIDKEWAAHNICSRHKAPISAVKRDGAIIAHGEVTARRNHQVLSLNIVGKIEGPGWGYVPALRRGDGGKIITVGKVVPVVGHGGLRFML